jgi:hypothetical protein
VALAADAAREAALSGRARRAAAGAHPAGAARHATRAGIAVRSGVAHAHGSDADESGRACVAAAAAVVPVGLKIEAAGGRLAARLSGSTMRAVVTSAFAPSPRTRLAGHAEHAAAATNATSVAQDASDGAAQPATGVLPAAAASAVDADLAVLTATPVAAATTVRGVIGDVGLATVVAAGRGFRAVAEARQTRGRASASRARDAGYATLGTSAIAFPAIGNVGANRAFATGGGSARIAVAESGVAGTQGARARGTSCRRVRIRTGRTARIGTPCRRAVEVHTTRAAKLLRTRACARAAASARSSGVASRAACCATAACCRRAARVAAVRRLAAASTRQATGSRATASSSGTTQASRPGRAAPIDPAGARVNAATAVRRAATATRFRARTAFECAEVVRTRRPGYQNYAGGEDEPDSATHLRTFPERQPSERRDSPSGFSPKTPRRHCSFRSIKRAPSRLRARRCRRRARRWR